MGGCQGKVGIAPTPPSPPKSQRGKRLSLAEQRLLKKYLPSFSLKDGASSEHVRIVGVFWNVVFRDTESTQGTSGASGVSAVSVASVASVRSFSRTKGKLQQAPRLEVLIDHLYIYLVTHAPKLVHVFRSSAEVQRRVLEHITTGMSSILKFSNDIDKMMIVTIKHLRFGVRPEYYEPLGKALLHALREVSGHYWSPQVEHAWRQLYGHCSVLLLKTHLNSLQPASKPHSLKLGENATRLPREQLALVEKYLPSFNYQFESTEEHRKLAASHWSAVFEQGPIMSTASPMSEWDDADSASMVLRISQTSNDNNDSARGVPLQSESQYHASAIGHLYVVFYEYIEAYEPELKRVFRSANDRRSKALLHISGGMRALLQSPDMADRVAQLTDTHLRVGVELKHFNSLGLALMYSMKECSGDTWSLEMETAWCRLYGHCGAVLLHAQYTAAKRNKPKRRHDEHKHLKKYHR
ncbi:TPA: hypothetical protein N0F65_007564 [Lagenidium giganteum]|uniref:Globin domain-containing protein n=1 Tax=Lagenidium giganteum TaxID=4803 RepID=A0AAV2ZLN8_9STRA|nr:TPA: hypothetical protein N0F65_007564 [Lagenidium giganteum]